MIESRPVAPLLAGLLLAGLLLAGLLLAGLLLAGLLLPGCGGDAPEATRQVTVYATASTTDAIQNIAKRVGDQAGIEVEANCASTSALVQQVLNGGGADVFLSANERWADYLEERGQVARRCDLLGNRIVIVVPADSPVEITEPDDLLDPRIEHLAMADPDAVPAGIYARESLAKLGLWKKLEPKVVVASNVRRALMFVETSAAEAGIVYATDAAASKSTRVAYRFGPDAADPIRYPILLLKAGEGNEAALACYDYVQGPEAAKVFEQYGFEVLAKPIPPKD